MRAAAQDAGVGISGFNGDAELSLIDPVTEAGVSGLSETVRGRGAEGSARSVTIHSNGLGEGGVVLNSYPELSDTVKLCTMFDTLRACAELAEASGIRMNLEPLNITTDHVGNFLATTRMAAEMTRLIGSPMLKVLYDVYHMQPQRGEPVRQHPGLRRPVRPRPCGGCPGRHEPGTGEIFYPRVLRCLEEAGLPGPHRL